MVGKQHHHHHHRAMRVGHSYSRALACEAGVTAGVGVSVVAAVVQLGVLEQGIAGSGHILSQS